MSNRRAKCPFNHDAIFLRLKDKPFFPKDTSILCQTCHAYYTVSGKQVGTFKTKGKESIDEKNY